MAHVHKRQWQRADGSKGAAYRAKWQDPDGAWHAKSFDRKRDAVAFLDTMTAGVVTGRYIDPDAGRITLREYGERYRTIQPHRPSTAHQLEISLVKHVYPSLGDRALSSIRPSDVLALQKRLSLTLAPNTVRQTLVRLSQVFNAAVRDRLITDNPVREIKMPRAQRKPVVPLSPKAVGALVDNVDPRYRAALLLAAGCGLRRGEVFGLTVDRVNFLKRELVVDRQLVQYRGGPPAFGEPKTDDSYRKVPVPQVVLAALAAHIETYGTGRDGLLFVAPRGGMVRFNVFLTYVWKPCVAAAALEVGGELPSDAGFHDLRHFYASALISAGESAKVVQSRLGHASAGFTLDTYGHLWPDSEESTRRAIDGILGERGTSEVQGPPRKRPRAGQSG